LGKEGGKRKEEKREMIVPQAGKYQKRFPTFVFVPIKKKKRKGGGIYHSGKELKKKVCILIHA